MFKDLPEGQTHSFDDGCQPPHEIPPTEIPKTDGWKKGETWRKGYQAGYAAALEEVREKREALAAIEHEQWIAWSKDIAATEHITPARLNGKENWGRKIALKSPAIRGMSDTAMRERSHKHRC